MSETKPDDRCTAQQGNNEPDAPFDDDLGERPRTIPNNVLSLDISQHSDEELAEMYESSRQTYSSSVMTSGRPHPTNS